MVARCQGHSSFVSAVAFDDLRCDGRTYRFGSVGEDNKLILWDFSSGALHRPKFQVRNLVPLAFCRLTLISANPPTARLHGVDGLTRVPPRPVDAVPPRR